MRSSYKMLFGIFGKNIHFSVEQNFFQVCFWSIFKTTNGMTDFISPTVRYIIFKNQTLLFLKYLVINQTLQIQRLIFSVASIVYIYWLVQDSFPFFINKNCDFITCYDEQYLAWNLGLDSNLSGRKAMVVHRLSI